MQPPGAQESDSIEPVIEPVLEISNLQFSWMFGSVFLDIPSLRVARGERVFLRGPSGSGKSTLLNLLTGVLDARHGSIRILGRELGALSQVARDRFRADHVGYIFQMFNLIPYLSVVENVCLPCGFSERRRGRATRVATSAADEARRLLQQLDLGDPALLQRPVTDLSVGQQQRVAVARALIGAPEVVIADEPTSALDAERRARFIELLFDQCAQDRTTVIFASHDASLAPLFDRTIELTTLNEACARNPASAASAT